MFKLLRLTTTLLFSIVLGVNLQVMAADNDNDEADAVKQAVPSADQGDKKSPKQPEQLEDITVQATRVDKSLYAIPAAVGVVNKDDIQLGRQQLGLDESLNKIPGLFMQNRYNFNQDLSISIRGFGKRSSFGVRGLRIYVDGIPNTLPDGQGNIDSIDIGSTERMEVIRGPSSSLYGAAAGGVINLFTENGPVDAPYVEGNAMAGSYDFSKLQVKTGGQFKNLNYLLNVSHLDYDGYRDHAKIERTLLNSKFRYDIDSTSDLTFTVNILDKPIANDPGGLCKKTSAFCVGLEPDRKAAQRNNIRFDAEETAEQQQLGITYRKSIGEYHEITARNYYLFRDFNGKLPIGPPLAVGGIIELDRFFTGGGLQYSYSAPLFDHRNRLTTGFDIDAQMDERKNFDNTLGTPTTTLRLDQNEDVSSWGVYLQNDFGITDALNLDFGIRYDEVKFDFSDHFLSDGDQSGAPEFSEWSPQAGLLWKLRDAINFYGNISTSFETPTVREFAAPTGPGGFNSTLTAQTSTNYEIGVKGLLPGRTSYQLSLFRIDTADELLPAGENAGGSVFFTNAGKTRRLGVEAGTTIRLLTGLDLTLAYTYSDFEFEKLVVNGMSFTGEQIPGIPEQTGYAEVAYFAPSGLFGMFDAQYVDKIYVNNAFLSNTGALVPQGAFAEDYTVLNFRAGYTAQMGNTEFTPFFAVNNLTGQKYTGNVRVNEGNLRFYEAAPELNVFVGFSLNFH